MRRRSSPGCSKLPPDGDLITCFPCAEAACCGCLRRQRCSPWPPLQLVPPAGALGAGLAPHHLPLCHVAALPQVLPGDYANSRSFQASLTVARRARRKYVLFRAIRLTGHSRGGSMADYVGRELGLPSLQINPGSWGKLFREEQAATALHPCPSPSPFTFAPPPT